MKKYTIGIVSVEAVSEEEQSLKTLSYLMQTDKLQNLYHYMELLALQNESLLGLSLANVVENFTYEQSYQHPCSYEMSDEGLLCWLVYGRTTVMHEHFDFEDDSQYEEGFYLTAYGLMHTVEEMRERAIDRLLSNN